MRAKEIGKNNSLGKARDGEELAEVAAGGSAAPAPAVGVAASSAAPAPADGVAAGSAGRAPGIKAIGLGNPVVKKLVVGDIVRLGDTVGKDFRNCEAQITKIGAQTVTVTVAAWKKQICQSISVSNSAP